MKIAHHHTTQENPIIDDKLAALDQQLRALGEARQELAARREAARCGPGGAGAFCRAIENHPLLVCALR